MLLAGEPIRTTDVAIVAVIIVAIVMLMLATHRRSRDSGPSPREYAREQIARLRDQQQIRDDMQELLVQLQELSRQINAQADTKFAKLEAAIADADRRIARLERLLQAADALPAAGASPDESSSTSPAQPPERGDPFRRRVFELADAGLDPVQIAKQTGRNTGEIELILNLRRRRTPPADRPNDAGPTPPATNPQPSS